VYARLSFEDVDNALEVAVVVRTSLGICMDVLCQSRVSQLGPSPVDGRGAGDNGDTAFSLGAELVVAPKADDMGGGDEGSLRSLRLSTTKWQNPGGFR
jgi:hypothetical protein